MHMQEPVQKSSDEVQKGDLGRAAKNILVAGAMGLAVDSMSPKDDNKSKDTKPKAERSVASEKTKKPKSKRFGDDEYMNSLDDKARARAEKVKDKYKNKLKKALMAGYGGAGTPTDLTGGGVFQAESLDSGRTQKADDGEFKYINCDNCGHEQVYMNHQVKCRKCHQNFNLSKLEDLI